MRGTWVRGIAAAVVYGVLARGAVAQDGARVAAGVERDADRLLSQKVTVRLTAAPIEDGIKAVSSAAGVTIQYQREVVRRYARLVTLSATHAALGAVLDELFVGTGLHVVVLPQGRLAVVDGRDGSRKGQTGNGTIKGRVTNARERGGAAAGVTVSVAGTGRRTVTSRDGRYVIVDVPAGRRVLQLRGLGYKPTTVVVEVAGDSTSIVDVILEPQASVLDEVITTATGEQRRVEVGNAITTLDVDSIRRTAPVASITDVLDGRVPGLVVQRSSGAPGAPARVRVRGISSINGSNDPIVIVDGVRVYSDQTTSERDARFSVFDNIDVNSVETIDVLKGPSASALYGSDAANGVIVIKTRRGRPGRTRWEFAADEQWTTQPRDFADGYYLEGTSLALGGRPRRCVLGDATLAACIGTRLFVFNPLGDARTTVFGVGRNRRYSATVSGGTPAVTYSVTGTSVGELGLLRMSDADVAYLERTTGATVPGWQRRPQRHGAQSGTTVLSLQPSPSLAGTVTTELTRNTYNTTPLDGAVGKYQNGWSPQDSVLVAGPINDYRRRTTNRETAVRVNTSLRWSRFAWWTVQGNGGVQGLARSAETLLRRGDCLSSPNQGLACHSDSLGALTSDRDDNTTGTVNLRTEFNVPSRLGVGLRPTVGLQYVTTGTQGTNILATDLPLGGTSATGAGHVTVSGNGSTLRQLGVYVETRVGVFDRLYTSVGTRVDASNALGKQVHPTYPKLDLSYLLSDEPFFRWKRAVNSLRLRLAYGHSAKQPEVGAALRTYTSGRGMTGGVVVPTQELATLGNPFLRPERSTELEGGTDVALWGNRVTLGVTGAHKLTHDLVVTLTRPPSLGSGQEAVNLGMVRNTSTELELGVVLASGRTLAWSANAAVTRQRNTLVHLAPTFDPRANGLWLETGEFGMGIYGPRYAEGYPIDGVWLRPVVRYTDVNGDGVITEAELVRADSAVFVGGRLPNYDANVNTQAGFWNGAVTVDARASYQNGALQPFVSQLRNLQYGSSTLRALNDPSTPLAEQVAVRSGYAAVHPVSTLRLESLSLRVIIPGALARRFGASSASVALQGSNLGLWTNYGGADPNVTSSIVGNAIYDDGVLPQPRTWGLNVRLGY